MLLKCLYETNSKLSNVQVGGKFPLVWWHHPPLTQKFCLQLELQNVVTPFVDSVHVTNSPPKHPTRAHKLSPDI